jgi:hypothetical protein
MSYTDLRDFDAEFTVELTERHDTPMRVDPENDD